ncbi:unnamed protein product, partial [marine sediment metagenome]
LTEVILPLSLSQGQDSNPLTEVILPLSRPYSYRCPE